MSVIPADTRDTGIPQEIQTLWGILPLKKPRGQGLVMISSFYSPESDIQNADNAAKADEACAPDMGESLGEEREVPHSWGAGGNLTSNFVSM